MAATNLRLPDASPLTRPRVLVADDSRVIRMAIKKILGADYELTEVGDGASAWDQVCADGNFQVVITDIEMPKVDGYELICRIRGAEETRLRELPVIAITGAEDEETKQRAFACGATDFIIKPIDAIQLRARVQAYVRYDQNARALTEKSETLEDQAILDVLTGLCSRRFLFLRGEQDLASAVRRRQDLTLVRVDIDHFKKLYKTHGDDVSEALLTWFGQLFIDTARMEDTVARVGGAQFAILANSTSIEAAATLCQRLQAAVADKPFHHNGKPLPITLSMGMASLVQDRRENMEGLLTLAQQRLAHAQSEGGNQVCISVLMDSMAIEEVVAPAVKPTVALLLPQTDPVADPVIDDSLAVAPLEDSLQLDTGFTMDFTGTGNAAFEPLAEATLSEFGSAADFSATDFSMDSVQTFPELEGVEMPNDSALESFEPTLDSGQISLPPDALAPPTAELAPPPQNDTLSIDKALHLLAQGKAEMLAPFLDALKQKIQPLVDLIQQTQRHTPSPPTEE